MRGIWKEEKREGVSGEGILIKSQKLKVKSQKCNSKVKSTNIFEF